MKKLLTAIILTICIAGWGQKGEEVDYDENRKRFVIQAVYPDTCDWEAMALDNYSFRRFMGRELALLELYIEHCERDSVFIGEDGVCVRKKDIYGNNVVTLESDSIFGEVVPTLEGYYEWLKNLLK
jgi:hypothetical protein